MARICFQRSFATRCLGAAMLLGTIVLSVGCRNIDNAQVDVMEQELRRQEDYIYELEDYLVQYSEKLRNCRKCQAQPVSTSTKSKATSKSRRFDEPELADDPLPSSKPKPLSPTLPAPSNGRGAAPPATREPSAPATTTPETEPAPTDSPPENLEDLEAPELEIGPAPGDAPSADTGTAAPLVIPDPIDYQDFDVEPAELADNSEKVTSLSAGWDEPPGGEPNLTAPKEDPPRLSAERLELRHMFAERSADGKPVRLLAVVEALNATDEPTDAPGEASLMVMTRDENGGLKSLGRWDFTAEETKNAWQSSQLGDGLHLELPLEDRELPEGELELWARVMGEDGGKLLTPARRPFRFEAAQLASMDDAATENSLAKELKPLRKLEGAASLKTADSKASQAATWRTSTQPMDTERVEGFASTVGSKAGGWTTSTSAPSTPRVAAAPGNAANPSWQKSSAPGADGKTTKEWTPFR